VIETARLRLRRWSEADRSPFAAINADPRVMEFMPKCLSREESDAFADRIETHFDKHGFGLYAAELLESREFIGFVGLSVPGFISGVEIGWRLRADCWGRGLATEGARAVATYAFETLGMRELISFTVPANLRSRRVMEKIGMVQDRDFDHPNLPEGHPLRRHVLYKLNPPESRPEPETQASQEPA
jgi:RimJ/RimL family protein N-acetyltransferase